MDTVDQENKTGNIEHFEQDLSALEKLVAELEGDSLTLAQRMSRWEQSQKLAKKCLSTLEIAQQQVKFINQEDEC